MTARAEVAHFVITGEFITQQARSFWNDEDEPDKAVKILEYLHGITKDQIYAVLEGRMRLTGDSSVGVGIEPDDSGYKGKTLADIVGKLKRERDEARDERDDFVQMAIGGDATECLASPTGLRRVPKRKTQQKTISGSRRTCLKDDLEFDDVLADPETPVIKGRGTKPLKVWQQVSPYPPAKTGHRPELMDLGDDEEDEEEEKRPPPPPAHDKIIVEEGEDGAVGWLSPEGKFYSCAKGYAQHAPTAWKLGLTDNPQNHFIEVDGWARLGVNHGLHGPEQYFFGPHETFGEIVNAEIKRFCLERGIKPPFWLE